MCIILKGLGRQGRQKFQVWSHQDQKLENVEKNIYKLRLDGLACILEAFYVAPAARGGDRDEAIKGDVQRPLKAGLDEAWQAEEWDIDLFGHL